MVRVVQLPGLVVHSLQTNVVVVVAVAVVVTMARTWWNLQRSELNSTKLD